MCTQLIQQDNELGSVITVLVIKKKKTETHQGEGTCPRSQSWKWLSWGSSLEKVALESGLLVTLLHCL